MNKNIAKPLIIQFTPPETNPALKRSPNSLFVPVNTPWNEFRDNVLPMAADLAYDSVLVHARDDVDRNMKGVVGNMAIKLNALAGIGTQKDKPVLSYEAPDKPFYLANPSRNAMKEAVIYAPSDDTIMERYNSYETDAAWQKHQHEIWERMKDMMPLSRKTDQFNRDHAAQLKDPKRGLEEKDLGKFWSFRSRQGLSPTIMGDDMIGMPSVEGREYDGFTMSINQPDGSVAVKPLSVRSLMTAGTPGIMIPMANADGYVNKHQVAADLNAYGTVLKFRAADGKTVSKAELFNKKTREYSFKFANGDDTHLKVTDVDNKETITMQDAHGMFFVKFKKEIIDVLKERGYDVPDIITSVKPEANGKYMWQFPGTMTGSPDVLKTVSPSNPGFIVAREPKNGEDKYVVLITEGALKGQIVAKYVDVTDSDGVCFGDKIAGNKGIIVTQVPGVAEAYVKNAVPIYDKYNVVGTYIAMDADGRENKNVAIGIHSAYKYINKVNPTTVLSWDPAQKGMDDALLAVAQGKITVEQMGIVSGKPEALFPLDKAHKMTPYKLDGTQTEKPAWMQEYEDDKKVREEKIAAAQAATAKRQEQKDMAGKWVETPDDISSIQNVTITKAAEMADAMAGNLPSAKPDSKIIHTPDVDEMATENIEQENVAEDIPINNAEDAAWRWDSINPAMPPLEVPEGYKATYNYQQPVILSDVPENLPENFNGPYTVEKEEWGVVDIETAHELSAEEKKTKQDEIIKSGYMTCIGDMRLTSQSFTLNNEMSVQLSADDLPKKGADENLQV